MSSVPVLDMPAVLSAAERRNPNRIALVLCIGYVGTGYHGLQLQTKLQLTDTVEGNIVVALRHLGLVALDPEGTKPLPEHRFHRACRTDRGVHAVRNILSVTVTKERYDAMGGPDPIAAALDARLREHPLQGGRITVLGAMRVSHDFIPRAMATRRIYHYLLPMYVLDRTRDTFLTPGQLRKLRAASDAADTAAVVDILRQAYLVRHDGGAFSGGPAAETAQAALAGVNATLRRFVGRHRFHNYSADAGVKFGKGHVVWPCDNESSRIVLRCAASASPLLLPYDLAAAYPWLKAPGVTALAPFALVQIEGGSFLFNMIRKVIGTAIAVARGASPDLLAKALDPTMQATTPLAPGAFLGLHMCFYDGYDMRRIPQYPPLCVAFHRHKAAAEDFEFEGTYAAAAAHDAASQDPAAGGAGPTPAEIAYRGAETMPRFAKALRVHNWAVVKSPHPFDANSKRAQKRAKRLREEGEEARTVTATTADGEPPRQLEVAPASRDWQGDGAQPRAPGSTFLTPRSDKVDPGWVTAATISARNAQTAGTAEHWACAVAAASGEGEAEGVDREALLGALGEEEAGSDDE